MKKREEKKKGKKEEKKKKIPVSFCKWDSQSSTSCPSTAQSPLPTIRLLKVRVHRMCGFKGVVKQPNQHENKRYALEVRGGGEKQRPSVYKLTNSSRLNTVSKHTGKPICVRSNSSFRRSDVVFETVPVFIRLCVT